MTKASNRSALLLLILLAFCAGCRHSPTQLRLSVSKEEPAKPAIFLSCSTAGAETQYNIETTEFSSDSVRWAVTPLGRGTVIVRLYPTKNGWEFDREAIELSSDALLRSFGGSELVIEFSK